MLLLSRTALSLPDTSILEDFLPELLTFVWIHLEHYMDSVRHNASGILQNLVKLGSAQQQTSQSYQYYLTN